MHISNLQIFPSNPNLTIKTNLSKLIKRNKINVIKSNCNFTIPFIIQSKKHLTTLQEILNYIGILLP